MENQNISKQDCGCSDGCCTPHKKSNSWKKWIFVVIILAAAAIVTVKLVSKDDTVKCCNKPQNTSCSPQSKSGNNE